MKNILIGLALLAATALLAQMPPPNGPRPTPEQLIQMFDRNGDGKISRDEAPLRMLQHWDDIDTDHDGFITLEELKARDARVAGMGNGSGQPALRESSARPESIPAVILGTRAFVNAANTSGLHDGKTWATAFASLQEALNSRAAEIWVAKGTYSPGNDRNATFQLHPDGAVYGGFTGNETRRDRRDWRKNKTVLEGQGAYHVVTGADDAVLDGFTVTGGNALGGPREGPPRGTGGGPMVHTTPDAVLSSAGNGCGAGMLNVQASPTVRNCIFENNQPTEFGVASSAMIDELVMYQFSRAKVERGDFSHFLNLYAPDKLPTGRRLRDQMNAFVFSIEGWDDDPREVHMIPEIRRFYAAFHDAWPYWLYFCNLDVDTLRAMTMCCLPAVSTMQVDGQIEVAVTCDPLDLLNLLRRDFLPMNLMCERAGMFENRICGRTRAVFEFFGLPFDIEPPSVKRFQ